MRTWGEMEAASMSAAAFARKEQDPDFAYFWGTVAYACRLASEVAKHAEAERETASPIIAAAKAAGTI